MCTLVRTRDVTVLLDAGVALGPRFRLMPHPREFRARDEARERINEAAAKAKVITISHYHNDHHTPNYLDPVWLGSTPELSEKTYAGKIVLAKDFRSNINTAQRRRGWMFKQAAEKWAEKFETRNSRTSEFGHTPQRTTSPHSIDHHVREAICVVCIHTSADMSLPARRHIVSMALQKHAARSGDPWQACFKGGKLSKRHCARLPHRARHIPCASSQRSPAAPFAF